MKVSRLQRIGVITVRGMNYQPTLRLAEAAKAKGCCIVPINPYTVWPVYSEGRPILAGDPEAHALDAALPRQGAEIRDASLPLITHLEQMGVPVINTRSAVERARNKFATLQCLAAAGLPVADTVFVSASLGMPDALAHFEQDGAVVKPVSGRQGTGICRMREGDPVPADLQAELDNGRGVLVQRFIAPRGRQDLRVLMVGGHLTAAMALQPADGDFRANVHLGGRARAVDLAPETAEIARRAADALGLDIAGVDLMITSDGRTIVNEVNYTPGFRGLEAASGKDVAAAIIEYVLEVIKGRQA
jgi:ribosomal protein S6--L-glutamate ligase